jgi:steroid delta-isomerase-like uncharacterized protein
MNKAIARRYIEELFTQGNLDVADELVAEDFVNHSPFGEEDTGDREGLKQAASGFLASFPDGQFVIDDMIAEGDLVAMRGTGRGTHTGEPFAGVAATGAETEFTWTAFLRIEDGQITERWAEADGVAMLAPLGFELAPPAGVAPPVTRALTRVNDITMYYEIHGEGQPLLFLHGGTATGPEGHPDQIRDFAREYQVIAPDSRGHGRTTDSDQPLSYALMASDVVQLLDHLEIDRAHVVGFSDGAIVALDLAINYPERVDKLVLGGANFHVDGLTEAFIEEAENLSVETYPPELAELFYLNIAPDPDHFPVFLEKISQMWLTQPNYTLEELGSITAPTLIIDGDLGETVRPEHVQEMAQAIPGAELRLIPDVGHLAPVLKPKEWDEAVLTFLREPEGTSELESATVATIETLIENTMQEHQVPGCAISVVKDEQLAYAKGFGVAELGSDRPITSQSLFHLASNAKTVVSTAIMQLVEQGKIDLDAPVTAYLPYFELADERYQEITIRQLMSHTAGMPDIEDWVVEWRDNEPQYDDGALEQYVRSLSDRSLLTAPGEAWAYSSIGFEVLGDVIAKVSGQSFEEYAQENIFTPLGMKHTTLLVRETDPELLTSPHLDGEAGQVVVSDFFPYSRVHGPSSTLYSNVQDMARYAMAHLNRGELDGIRILQESSYDEVWTPHADTTIPDEVVGKYGLGWMIGEYKEHQIISHGGLDPGFNSNFALIPEQSTAFLLACNYTGLEEGISPAFMLQNGILDSLLEVEE